MKRALLAVAATSLVLLTAPAHAAETDDIVLIGMDMAPARALVSRSAAVGLGVFPAALRGGPAFLNELYAIRPWRKGAGGYPGESVDRLIASCVDIRDETATLYDAPQGKEWLISAFSVLPRVRPGCDSPRARLTVTIARDPDEAEGIARDHRDAFIFGADEGSAAVLVAWMGHQGLLRAPDVRRAGVVTAYDVVATLFRAFGIDRKGVAGQSIDVVRANDPLAHLDALAARLERDASYGPGVTKVTDSFGLAALFLGALTLARRRARWAGALARAGAMTPAGYVASLFVPSGRAEVRGIAIAAAFAIGLFLPARNNRRAVGWILVGTSVAIAVLTVAAALRPNGEPALSLWGNPLVSWRFFGLRNHLAASLSGGFIAGATLLEWHWLALTTGAAAAGVVVGAPRLGANFIGVLTLGFGAGLAIIAVASKRVRAWQLIPAALTGTLAIGFALWVDSGSPVSHGGRAVETVRAGGLGAAWRIFRARWDLNWSFVGDILGGVGYVAAAALVIASVALILWAFGSWFAPASVRAGVGGAAAAALAALLGEDSGFLTAGLLAFYAWLAYAAFKTDEMREPPPPPEPVPALVSA